jgi:hypothetical protein
MVRQGGSPRSHPDLIGEERRIGGRRVAVIPRERSDRGIFSPGLDDREEDPSLVAFRSAHFRACRNDATRTATADQGWAGRAAGEGCMGRERAADGHLGALVRGVGHQEAGPGEAELAADVPGARCRDLSRTPRSARKRPDGRSALPAWPSPLPAAAPAEMNAPVVSAMTPKPRTATDFMVHPPAR